MLPTVADVLALPELRSGAPRVIAGRAGLDRPVRWVHVSEIPDIAALLKGGELILTTGIAWPSTDEGVARYLDELDRAEASGVVIELGRRFPEVPAAVIEAAQARGFPLVELARPVPFVAVTEVVHRLIVNSQFHQLEFSDQAHRAFTALSLEGASVQEILDQAESMAGEPVVLEDLSHRAIAYSAGPLDPAEVLRDWEARSRSGTSAWLTTPVGPRRHRWGRLVIPSDRAASAQYVMLLERAAEALALLRLVERDRAGLEQQAHGGLLADLVRDRSSDRPALRARAEALGFPLARQSLLGVCVGVRGAERAAPVVQEERDRALAESVADACRTIGVPALVSSLAVNQVLVLLAVPRGRRVEPVLDQLTAALDGHAAGESASRVVGAGRPVDALEEAAATLSEARHVVDVMSSSAAPGARAYHRVTDLGLRGLLAGLRDDPRLVGFAESQLGPLLAHDAQRGTTLEATLSLYLDAGGNKSRMARDAHLSRPALYARLAVIERLLGVDLEDANAAAGLRVALLVRSLRAAESQPA